MRVLRLGGNEPFNEGAAQVKRLISRDRQEFLGSRVVGNQGDIMEKWQTEFGEDAPSSSSPAPAGTVLVYFLKNAPFCRSRACVIVP